MDVVYASSFYGGAAHASGPYSGEFIGILAAETPGDVEEGLRIAVDHAQNRVSFLTADPEGKLIFLSHLVSSCGTYVAEQAGIPVGTALAWLTPPLEATFGLDAALKAADVQFEAFPAAVRDQLFRRLACRDQAACQGVSGSPKPCFGVAAGPLERF
ncbi:MAG: microcompartment protein EutL [Bilophila wadsworthia]